jgi:hypothetical protein
VEFAEIAREMDLDLKDVMSLYSSGMRKLKISMDRLRESDPMLYNEIRRMIQAEPGSLTCPLNLGQQDLEHTPDDYEIELQLFYDEFYAE